MFLWNPNFYLPTLFIQAIAIQAKVTLIYLLFLVTTFTFCNGCSKQLT